VYAGFTLDVGRETDGTWGVVVWPTCRGCENAVGVALSPRGTVGQSGVTDDKIISYF
jgi:hypothetical protein